MGSLVSTLNERIQFLSKEDDLDTTDISDGFHTFGELYEFRCALTNALFKQLFFKAYELNRNNEFGPFINPIWKSRLHSDGTMFPGFFIIGYSTIPGQMITFHYPEEAWELFDYARVSDNAPEWDGHTSADVLERIKNL